jgi:hypothetical protein
MKIPEKEGFLYHFQLVSQISFTLIDYIFVGTLIIDEIVILKYILKM